MNKKMIIRMMLDKKVLYNSFKIVTKFKQSPNCHIRNLIKSARMLQENNRIVEHEGYYMLHSFFPPVNSKAFLNMTMRAPGKGREFFDNYVQGKRTAPISTYIAATNRCMYNCWHCSANRFVKNQEINRNTQMTTEELLTVVKKLQRQGVSIFGFTGGEPLLRKDLEKIIKKIEPTSISYVFTTGYGLSYERALSLKKAGLFGIAISIDSIHSKVHDKKRGYKGAYDIAINAIRNAKMAGLYTMSQTVGTKELIRSGEIFELAHFLKKLGIDEMRIMEPLPSGRLVRNKKVLLTKAHIDRLKKLHIYMNRNLKYPKVSVFPFFEGSEYYGCGAGSQHSYVDNLGNFGPCDFINKTYGNLLEENINEIWDRMHQDMGVPKCYCVAKSCNGCGENVSKEIPRFYKTLGGMNN